MSISPLAAKTLALLALPPGLNFILLFLALIVLILGKSKCAYFLGLFSIFSLYLCSTPYIAVKLAELIEPEQALVLDQNTLSDNQAIVLLGCSRYANPLEYTDDSNSACTLSRIHYTLEILNTIDLPLLVTGGSVFNESLSEAEIVSRTLTKHFNVEAEWLDTQSQNTIENAHFTFEILNKRNIKRIILVTHAMHMKRAESIFTKTGFIVTKAPTHFIKSTPIHSAKLALIPSSKALYNSSSLIREILGLLWFRISFK